MPVMNFNLEDGLPPVSFSLKTEDCKRFLEFMAECQSIKDAPKPMPLTDGQIGDIAALFYAKWRGHEGFARAIEAAHGIKEQ